MNNGKDLFYHTDAEGEVSGGEAVLSILRENVTIPDCVQNKAENILGRIRAESQANKNITDRIRAESQANTNISNRIYAEDPENKIANRKGSFRIGQRKFWKTVITAASLIILTATAVTAAYRQWSRSLLSGFQTDSGTLEALEEEQYLRYEGQSVTNQGITVTVNEVLTDNYCAWLTFQVSGFTPDEDAQPGFASMEIYAEDGSSLYGEGSGGIEYGFYDGTIISWDGKAVSDDGSAYTTTISSQYLQEDGSLSWQCLIRSSEAGTLAGREIHVELQGLGECDDTGKIKVSADGTWTFDLTLPGNEEEETYEIGETLENTGAIVQRVSLTPLSAVIYYDLSELHETVDMVNEDAANFVGFKMKDGTLVRYTDGLSGEYTDDSRENYKEVISYGRILETEEIDCLLFVKDYPEGETASTEDDLYIIPLE